MVPESITLKTLHSFTPQQIFDYVVDKLRKQNRKSMNIEPGSDEGVCVYRSDDGCKCAAGHLIGDDEYTPKMEGMVFFGVESVFENLFESPPSEEQNQLIGSLQSVHDSTEVSEWEEGFKTVSIRYGLTYTEPKA